MAQVQREKEQTENIEGRDINVLKPVNHHRVNVVMAERIGFEQKETPISHAHGEMGSTFTFQYGTSTSPTRLICQRSSLPSAPSRVKTSPERLCSRLVSRAGWP